MIKHPHLIQRCELRNGKLEYDCMGMTEFEIGGQAKALKQIFATGITLGSTKIVIEGKELKVFMVAGRGFPFDDYQRYLQQLAENWLRLPEWTNFDEAVKMALGLPVHPPTRTNVWFDFPNEILWTLSEENQHELVQVLEGIKATRAAKAVQAPQKA